jgi:prophage regulatory protein
MVTNQQQVYFSSETEQLIGRDRQTLRRWWTSNIFPKPKLINKRLAWSASVLHEWITKNVHGVQANEEQTNK